MMLKRATAPMLLLAATVGAFSVGISVVPKGLHGPCRSLSVRAGRRRCGAVLSVRAAEDGAESNPAENIELYASLQKRRTQLASRGAVLRRERALVAELADTWAYKDYKVREERAVSNLWDLWYGEEGEAARFALLAAEGNAAALKELMDIFPDWAEPTNRLATLRFLQGDFDDSAQLCLRVLRTKPWHFGASSGIVMVYANMGKATDAEHWARQALPGPGPDRQVRRERGGRETCRQIDRGMEEGRKRHPDPNTYHAKCKP